MHSKGKLFFFTGKMGAGKSTKAKRIATENNAVLIAEDEWLSAHFPGQIKTFEDYLSFSTLIRPFIKQHVVSLLSTGSNVVMDFPANTVKQRQWFLSISNEIGCEHELLYLDVSDQQCLYHIAKRRIEQPERNNFDTEAVFQYVTQYFEAPGQEEGVNIVFVND